MAVGWWWLVASLLGWLAWPLLFPLSRTLKPQLSGSAHLRLAAAGVAALVAGRCGRAHQHGAQQLADRGRARAGRAGPVRYSAAPWAVSCDAGVSLLLFGEGLFLTRIWPSW
ncbi:MAG: hypothetical protein R3A10_20690 [Caldilineaceae bacterium]